MNRKDFLDFCAANNLTVGEYGKYVYAIIRGEDSFAAAQPILESGEAWLARGKLKDGAGPFVVNGFVHLPVDQAKDVTAAMAMDFAGFLIERANVTYINEKPLDRLNRLMEDHPVLEGESEDEYVRRLEGLEKHEWGFSAGINETGFWDADYNLIVSDDDLAAGIWSYNYDNWEQRVLLVLDPKKAEEDEAA